MHTHTCTRLMNERIESEENSKTCGPLLKEGMAGVRSVGAKPSAVVASTAATAILDAVSATTRRSFR
jgi:hypothetical protein